MMMPANFSAVAENEMTYVVGGGLVDILADPMTTANWKNINTNLINIVGNTYLNTYLPSALSKVFGGMYTPGENIKGWADNMQTIWTKNDTGSNSWGFAYALLNTGLQVVGGLSAIYTLGDSKIGLKLKDNNFGTVTIPTTARA